MLRLTILAAFIAILLGCSPGKSVTKGSTSAENKSNAFTAPAANNLLAFNGIKSAISEGADERSTEFTIPDTDPLIFKGNYVIEEPDTHTLVVYPETGEWNNFFAGILYKDSACKMTISLVNSHQAPLVKTIITKTALGMYAKDSLMFITSWQQPVISRAVKARITFSQTPEVVYFGDLQNPNRKYAFTFYYKQ
ncbi:hypothetical protein [Foetidibacter luteolus]|uniref:hypothetical protein n=1 Tax=Foetidibacter luteolus TaxID=2608880 RepID=UPI00129AE7DE|nr:hypothetical protein [Foetidibacter luteolus]